ncbi:hypothetical protein H8356DRAFT_1081868 [Neocallimastix lanati (nom. inval.)]|nr:hypothetical protein H8356DRAFT_1081868 [Neocallimastix sp. JGI-2020a]
MSNLNFNNNNNINNNKLECGTIHFINDLSVLITNSTFNNNISKGDGGVICLDNISNLNLTTTYFIKNKAMNGGAIYISDSVSKDIDNINDNIYNNIKIENNVFKENTANLYTSVNYINRSSESSIDMESLNIAYGKQGKQILIKKIKVIYYSILEIVLIHIILNISFLLFSIIHVIYENKNIKNNKEYNIIQNENGEWIYKCNIEKLDFSLNLNYLLIYIFIIPRSIKLLKYEYIFKSTKYASYTVLISFIFGPLINVLYSLNSFIIY